MLQDHQRTMPVPATLEYPKAATEVDVHAIKRSRWHSLVLAIVAVNLILLFAPTLSWLWTRWTMSVWHNAHGMFVPPLVAWLVWQDLRRHPELRAEAGTVWGFALLAPSLMLHALDAGMHTELLSAIALVLVLPALSLLFLGWHRTRVIAFPLAFALFALPIPLGMTETAHLLLRQITVAFASNALPYLGVTLFTEGTTLHLAGGELQIADACSGFSTLYAAVAVAALTAYTAATTARRALVIIGAVPIAIASNIVRVTLLVLLVDWRGEEILKTFIHPLSGLMTFAISLPLIFWLGGPARNAEPAPAAQLEKDGQ